MIFERIALTYLRNWKTKANRKPLVIRGARQVGKTSLVKAFGQEFDIYLQFNLEVSADMALFEHETSVQELFDIMLAVRHQRKQEGASVLVFIDEIQNSPLAIKQLRYFYEEMPFVHIIAAGSLLETMLHRQISFPVGRVEYMSLRPCTFYEFLGAMGEHGLQQMLRECSVPAVLHRQLMQLFNRYTLLGGMPQAIAEYAENRDLVALDTVYQSLLTGYVDDVEKYQSREASREVLRFCIKEGWSHAAERVAFDHFAQSNYKSREVGEAMRTLQKTMLLELVYPTTATMQPLTPDLRKRPKLLWLDTGLVNYAAGIQQEVLQSTDINDAWRGRIAEHIIGQELLAVNNDFLHQRHFWVREARNAQAELDFVYLSRQHGLLPIEVKSGSNAHLRSLHLFMQESSCRLAVRFWAEPMSSDTIEREDGTTWLLLNLPYYYAGQIESIFAKYAATK